MGLPGWLCYRIARRMLRRRRPGDAGANPASLRRDTYQAWRDQTLREHFDRCFGDVDLRGSDVLDFGCGDGGLSFHVAARGVRSITGIDLKAESIDAARATTLPLPVQPRFLLAGDDRTLDLPDAAADVILCFDVLEHIMEYEAIVREWVRVLRPGGRVLILWVPWWHPYGPHINSLVPIPWAHVLFAERVLLETCARIYDAPDFQPKFWDLDEHGRKKPNKWRALDRLPAVNRLSIRRFERLCRAVGLRIARVRYAGFGGGGALARAARLLTRVPGLREFFTSHTMYELRKPRAAAAGTHLE